MARRSRTAEAVEEEAAGGPRRTATLHGQTAAERAALEGLHGGRMHHAWLLTGERGVGKATLAFRIARHVLAGRIEEGDALFGYSPPASMAMDERAPVFQRVAAAGHSDLLTIERGWSSTGRRSTAIAVDDVRRISDFLHLTPGEGGWRVVIVDSVDDLNISGANALLKILEEPPVRALMLLVCHAPGRLSTTLRSRCRRLALDRLDSVTIERVVREQRPEMDGETVSVAARLADGSAGRAVDLIDGDGVRLYRRLIDLLETLPRLDIAAAHGLADEAVAAGPSGESSFRLLGEQLRSWLARVCRARHMEMIDPLGGESDLARRLAGGGSLEPWIQVWDKIDRLFERADAVNLDRKHVVVTSLLAIQGAAWQTAGDRAA